MALPAYTGVRIEDGSTIPVSLPGTSQSDLGVTAAATSSSATSLATLVTTVLGGSLKSVLQAGAAAIGRLSLPSTLTTAQQTVGTSAVQLTAVVTPVKNMPIVKADPANLGIVYVIISGAGTTGTGFPLAGGEALPVAIDDLSKLWFIASLASQKVAVVAGL